MELSPRSLATSKTAKNRPEQQNIKVQQSHPVKMKYLGPEIAGNVMNTL